MADAERSIRSDIVRLAAGTKKIMHALASQPKVMFSAIVTIVLTMSGLVVAVAR